MSNAERIALTRKQEFGYDEFNTNSWYVEKEVKTIKVKVNGVIRVFKPEGRI